MLDNGLTVIVQRANAAPLVSIQVRIEAGSADELPGEYGVAHFLEHMVFKGSPSRGVGEMSAEIEGLGGDLNAYTTVDHTVLHATVEASSMVQALDVLADMLTSPLLDPQETQNEREVVLDEIRGYDDDPSSVTSDVAQDHVFPGHPFGRPVIGTAETVKALDHETLRTFWRREWGAERALLVIAGDVAPLAAVAAVRDRLSRWHRSESTPVQPESVVSEPAWYHVPGRFDAPAIEMAWSIPGPKHADMPALEVACAMLGQSSASLLQLRLVMRDRSALDVGSYTQTWRDAGTFTVSVSPHNGRSTDAVAAIRHELARLGRSARPSDVRRARESLLADAVYAAETVDGIAGDLLDSVACLGNVAAKEAYRGALAGVSADDVSRVVTEWLQPDKAVVACTDAQAGKLAPVIVTRAVRTPERIVRDDGATILLLPDNSPVAAIRCAGLGGALNTPTRSAGIGSAWASLITAGAASHDAAAFARAVEGLSGGISAISGRNSIGLSASFPADCFARGLDLFGAALTAPRFDADEWERVRETMEEDERTVLDRPGQVLRRLTWKHLYREHPWRLPVNGTLQSIASLTPGRIRRWHMSQLTPDNLVFVVAGGLDRDEVLETLEPWLQDLPSGPHLLMDRPTPAPLRIHSASAQAGNEQAWINLAMRGPDMHAPNRAAIDLATTILGGAGGRLFLSLREERGLAYSVWSSSAPGWDGGLVSCGLATDPSRQAEATTVLRAEMERLAADGPTEAEVKRCTRLLIGGTAMGLQRASGRAANAALGERYGTHYELEDARTELEALTASEVQSAWRDLMDSPTLEVTVTPRS
ncbi:MAG: zinc protease [Myxococcota bacterium]